MAKAATIAIKMLSTADTGYFYVASKNPRKKPETVIFVLEETGVFPGFFVSSDASISPPIRPNISRRLV
jgi:hypothetical protein